MLIGAPASGKTTWRECLVRKHTAPLAVISTDDLIQQYANERGLTYSEAFNQITFKDVDSAAVICFQEAIAQKKNIIIDRTNMSKSSRSRWLRMLPQYYYRYGVVFQLPRDDLNARLTHRAETTGKYISASVVDEMLRQFEFPQDGEFHAVLEGGPLPGFGRT